MKVSIIISAVNLLQIAIAEAAAKALKLYNPEKYKNIWMITERGDDARDNGYFFFKYLRETHPEINAVYVIDPSSPDAKKVEAIGKTVPFMSWKHKILTALSKVSLSTHHNINSAYKGHYRWSDNLSLRNSKRVMLQHGITKDNMQYFHHDWLKADLFICGAKPEYDYIRETFGYPEGVVQYTGFARYDNLLKPHTVKKQILLMPTWRSYAVRNGRSGFIKSLVYKKYQSLINNKQLIAALRKYGYQLVFYPHYEMQRFIADFRTMAPDVIQITGIKDADVQTLLMESAFLITDYSSVYFDFAYMGKSLFYYQFDAEEYRKGHYAEGYFNYEKDGFGKVVRTESELIFNLSDYLLDNGVFKSYKTRTDSFFPLRDENNCSRIYDAVCSLNGEGRRNP